MAVFGVASSRIGTVSKAHRGQRAVTERCHPRYEYMQRSGRGGVTPTIQKCQTTTDDKTKKRRVLPWKKITNLTPMQSNAVCTFRFSDELKRSSERREVKGIIDKIASNSDALRGPFMVDADTKLKIHAVLYSDRTTGDWDNWFTFLIDLLSERATDIKRAHRVDKTMLSEMPSVAAYFEASGCDSESDEGDPSRDLFCDAAVDCTVASRNTTRSPRRRLKDAMEDYSVVCHAVSLVVACLFNSSILNGLAPRQYGWPLENKDETVRKMYSMCADCDLDPIVDIAWLGPC